MKNMQHCHHLNAADVLRHRRPNQETVKKFENLLSNGHSPASALESHKFDLQMDHGDDFYAALADGSLCPNIYWCHYTYRKMFKKHYGDQSGELMLKSLEEFVTRFNNECGSVCAKLSRLEEDFVVVICTPLMKRVHAYLRASREMMLVDSSGNLDRHGTRVFMMMTPSVAGALPLGILLTSSESGCVLERALNEYKSILPDDAFFGKGESGPSLIMTDDCAAERNSLKANFPGAVLLPCIFHVLQAFWRWLLDPKHQIESNHRAVMFEMFKAMLNSRTDEEFNSHYEKLKEHPTYSKYNKLQIHLSEIMARCKEWALCFRSTLLTRGNNTNNFCEATMRLLKDAIFFRTKAFSVVQLFDFCTSRVDAYYQRKLSMILANRTVNYTRSKYFVPEKKLSSLSCEKLSENVYLVKNSVQKSEYHVNTALEMCSCFVGCTGAPCKHQWFVIKTYNLTSQQFLPFADEVTKKTLHIIMTGSLEGVPTEWYASLRSKPPHFNGEDHAIMPHEVPVSTSSENDISFIVNNDVDLPGQGFSPNNEELAEKCIEKLDSVFSDMKETLLKKPDLFIPAFQKFADRYESECLKYDNTCASAMHSLNRFNNPKALRIGKRISVQTTAVQRRKAHLGGGRNIQITGRPPKKSNLALEHGYNAKPKTPKWMDRVPAPASVKRPHCLSYRVEQYSSQTGS